MSVCVIRPCAFIIRGRGKVTSEAHSASRRLYHSYEHDEPAPFNKAERFILSAALTHVPSHGFTPIALSMGAQDAGYLGASVNLFPKGVFDLANYHLVTQRLALKHNVQFPEQKLGVGAKVRILALQRLRANEAVIKRWQEVSVFSSPILSFSCERQYSDIPFSCYGVHSYWRL